MPVSVPKIWRKRDVSWDITTPKKLLNFSSSPVRHNNKFNSDLNS